MTYCVGLKLRAGMVLLSDSRTNAGLDNIATFCKTHRFEDRGDRVITMLSAGNLSVTQTVLIRIQEAIQLAQNSDDSELLKASILHVPTIFQAVQIVGDLLAEVSQAVAGKLGQNSEAAQASFIFAGQREGGEMRLFHVYSAGNFIEATEETPYLQIGEHKYGKPILDRVIDPDTSIDLACKALLISMDSTMRSNLSVGMPLDLTVILAGENRIHFHQKIEENNAEFKALSDEWSQILRKGFLQSLPEFHIS